MRQRSYLQLAFIGLLSLLYLAPLSFINVSAEQTSYNGLWITENQLVSQSYDQQGNIRFAFNVVAKIYTNDPSANGTVQVTYYENYYPNQAITENVTYQGYYTEVILNNYYSDLNGSLRQTGTFTVSNNNISTQIIELDDDQLQALINQFIAVQDAIENIDDLIDTISWKDDPFFQFLGFSTTIDGTLQSSISSNSKTIYFHFFYGGSGDAGNSNLKKIRTNVTTSITAAGDNSQPSLKLYYFNGTDYILRSNVDLWCRRDLYGRCTIYSTYSFYTNPDRHFVIEFTWPTTSGRATTSSALDCHYIGINDIEYWQMLYYLTALNGQTLIINNQQTIINQQEQSNQYNEQQYDTTNNSDETSDISGFMVDYDNKLGFIGQTFDFITSLFGVITNADISSTIPFPGVTVPIGENGSNVTLIQAQNVDIVPSGLSSIFEYVRLANSLIIVSAVFNMAINKYKEWSMK